MNTEFSSRRRLLLLIVLPVSLLLIATPFASHLPFPGQSGAREPQQIAAAYPKFQTETDQEVAPRISPSTQRDVQKVHRQVALDIVARLENEALRENGKTRLTSLDLKRLRNALR